MSDFITTSRELVKRGWSDFEPKLVAGLLSGGAATAIVSILTAYGVKIDAPTQHIIVVALYFLGGWLTPSSGTKVVVTHNESGVTKTETSAFTGNVKTTTQSTPIQASTAHMSAAVRQAQIDAEQVSAAQPYTPPTQNPAPLPPLPRTLQEMVAQSSANDKTQVLP